MFVFDTDHASLYQQAHPALGERLRTLLEPQLAITVVSYEEQISGRLAVIHRARQPQERIQAFFWLQQTLHFYCQMPILAFDQQSAELFQQLATQKLRVGTQDLLIAAIVIANNATLLTRNSRDFQRVPGLLYEDWSIPLN